MKKVGKVQKPQKKRKVKEINITITHPSVAAEWDYEQNYPVTPDMISYGCGEKFWWICKRCSYSWKTSIRQRCRNQRPTGCPACNGKCLVPGRNDIATVCPDLVDEWDYEKNFPLTPNQVAFASGKKYWWSCKICGYSWAAVVSSRSKKRNPTGCPACNGKCPVLGKNDIATVCPDLVDEWDFDKNYPLTPNQVMFGSDKKYWWKCIKCSCSWEASAKNRSKQKRPTGCPVCNGKCLVPGKNDIATVCPDLIDEWDYEKNFPLTPNQVAFASGKKYWWKCIKCSCSWEASAKNRSKQKRPTGCPVCNGKCLVPGRNDIATVWPDLVDEWDFDKNYPLTPDQVTFGNHDKYWWSCIKCGHSWAASANNRCNKKHPTGCPVCNGKCLVPGRNDIATVRPDLVDEWDFDKNYPLTPDQVAFGNHDKYWWSCIKCGHSWAASANNRCNKKYPTGCPVCNRKCLVPGRNDIATVRPDLIDEWDFDKNYPLTPNQVMFGSGKKYWWKCKKCKCSWETSPKVRCVNSCECPYCCGHRKKPS